VRQRLLFRSDNGHSTTDCDASYHGICTTVQNGCLAASGCCRGELPVSDVGRQVLQLCGSPTEVWRIATKLGPAFHIKPIFGENAAFQPTRKRALVMIYVSKRRATDRKRDKHGFPAPLPHNVGTLLLNVGTIPIGIVTVVGCTATLY